MQELKDKTAEIEETIRSLQEDIMEAGGMDLRLQKIVVDDVRKRIDNLNNKITKAMVAKAKAEKDVAKLESSIRKTEKDSSKIEEDLKELEEEQAQKAAEFAKISKEMDDAKKVEKKGRVFGSKKDANSDVHHVANGRKEEAYGGNQKGIGRENGANQWAEEIRNGA